MKVAVLDVKGKETGRKVDLSDAVYKMEPNNHAIYLDVKQYMAHQRQGTHKTKERAEIVGSTRKIKKQKGTGTARAGSIKSPIFRGGGRIFGPRPKDYSQKLNKNVKSKSFDFIKKRFVIVCYTIHKPTPFPMICFLLNTPKSSI